MKVLASCVITFLVFLFSCKKIGNSHISGVVSETGTNKPIAGATVIFQYWKDHCKTCPYLYDSVYTDSQGRYEIEFKKKLRHIYTIGFRDNHHYRRAGTQIREKESTMDVTMDGYAYLKFRVRKQGNSANSFSISHDSFHFRLDYNQPPLDSLLPKVVGVRAYQPFRLKWVVGPLGGPYITYYSEDLKILTGDTLVYVIEYN